MTTLSVDSAQNSYTRQTTHSHQQDHTQSPVRPHTQSPARPHTTQSPVRSHTVTSQTTHMFRSRPQILDALFNPPIVLHPRPSSSKALVDKGVMCTWDDTRPVSCSLKKVVARVNFCSFSCDYGLALQVSPYSRFFCPNLYIDLSAVFFCLTCLYADLYII